MEFFLKNTMNKNNKGYRFSIFFLSHLLEFLPKKRKKEFNLLIYIFLVSSLLEALNVSLILPLVSIFEDISNLNNYETIKSVLSFYEINTKEQILKYMTFLFILISIVCGIIKYLGYKLLFTFSALVESDVRDKIFSNNLYLSYEYHINNNSNEALTIISQKTHFLFNMLTAYLGILSSLLLSVAILITLLLLKPLITLSIFLSVSIIFILIYFLNKKRLSRMSKDIASEQFSITYIFQEAFGFLSEILIYSLQTIFIDKFKTSSKKLAKNLAKTRIISESPRIYLEYLLIIFFILTLYYFTIFTDNNKIDIALISLLGFASLKLLPLAGKIYNYFSTIKSLQMVFEDIMNILKKTQINTEIINHNVDILTFNKSIQFKNISFTYKNEIKRKKILSNFNFEIKKNSFVGIKGTTGKGKSTLVKILMGLLLPDEGHIEIDNIKLDSKNIDNWKKKISILPQKVFLNDASIIDNITLGESKNKINFEKVKNSAKSAEILEFIDSLPNKFDEGVGENGAKLSGGQIKRIGIARALYRKSADIIILDEPTNELDKDTELKILHSLRSLKDQKTIIVISHNIEILSLCDQTIDFDNIL